MLYCLTKVNMIDTLYAIVNTNKNLEILDTIFKNCDHDITETKMCKMFQTGYASRDYMMIDTKTGKRLLACMTDETLTYQKSLKSDPEEE